MIVIHYAAFVILSVVCTCLTYKAWRVRKYQVTINNPNFAKFQREYFPAYCLALVADWLQGPYLYKLYRDYGFEQAQIAVLYVFGFAAAVVLGTFAPFIASRFGRRNLCIVFTIIYSVSCFMKLSRSYLVLLLGRVFGGMATSLLFSSFEAWYIHEHVETHDFPKEWIGESMKKLSIWNGFLAVISGLVANITAEWMHIGSIAPFMLAVPCLLISGIVVMTTWKESYGRNNLKFKPACIEGLREIGDSKKILLLCSIQALFESVLSLMIFLWTPVLYHDNPSLGIIFSCFMVCIMIGTALHDLSTDYISNSMSLTFAITLAFLSCCCCAAFATPHHIYIRICFIGFLLYEISVGVYFSAISKLREAVIPESHSISIMNWLRVPLNLISCAVLMLLHDESFRHGNRLIFIICCFLLLGSLLCVSRLTPLLKQDTVDDNEVGSNVQSDI